ncbi:Down syndrome cell adhesion molecule-like protein, partial [Stegodyphus mimosarum]
MDMFLFVRWIMYRTGKPPPVVLGNGSLSLDKRQLQWFVLYFVLCCKGVLTEDKIRIQPFHFPANVKEGLKVQMYCGLIEGEAPVHFQWQKNGESLTANDNVNIMTHQDFSRLVINKVDVESSGNYTCVAKNNRGQDMYSAHLAVRGPPKWVREPTDISTSVGEAVTLTCATFGYPTPDVTWRKANESAPDQWIHLTNSQHIRLENNGSLTILNVQNDDSG